ncbi:MAG: PqqD family protein [Chloroflexota bacterium]|nr:PqqD family protein [Chloroflexota bacterium]
MISPKSQLRRNPDVVARDLADGEGGVLLHMATGQYHGINAVGLAIWELIGDGRTVEDLTCRLRDRVEDPPPSLDDDVLRFLTSVHERDLVVIEQ